MIGGPSEKEHESAESWIIVAILLLGLLLRLPFAAREFRTTSDVETYRRWARTIRQQGLETIYAGTDVDYPPLILYLPGGAAKVEAQLPFRQPVAADRALTALIKLPAIIADTLTAAVILRALRGQKPAIQVLACASYTFHSAIWYVSAHWGQTDSIYTLFLVASVVALERGRLAAGSQGCPSLDGVEIRFPGETGFPGRWFTRKTGLWWAYGVLSLTFLYNLVTIASPVSALWTNLVAPQPDSGLVLALRGIAVLVAAANTATLVGLIAWLAGRVAP